MQHVAGNLRKSQATNSNLKMISASQKRNPSISKHGTVASIPLLLGTREPHQAGWTGKIHKKKSEDTEKHSLRHSVSGIVCKYDQKNTVASEHPTNKSARRYDSRPPWKLEHHDHRTTMITEAERSTTSVVSAGAPAPAWP